MERASPIRAEAAATAAAGIPCASSTGRRMTPAPPPASLNAAPRARTPRPYPGRPGSAPQWEPVTTTHPASSGRTSEAESQPTTAGRPSLPAGRSTNLASSPAGGDGGTAGAGRAAMRSAAAAQSCPGAQPRARAGSLQWLMRPRAYMSPPSPMRAESWATAAAGMPSGARNPSDAMPASSRPTAASLRITPRRPARAAR